MDARLKTGFRVGALLRQGAASCRQGVVVRKGDPDAGDVLLLLRGPDGLAVFRETRVGDGNAAWRRVGPTEAATDSETDVFLARQVDIDPDLWVVEFETRDFIPPSVEGWR